MTGKPKNFPTSHPNVQSIIVKHAHKIKSDVIWEFESNKASSIRMSITADEYTSLRNRKYINMNR